MAVERVCAEACRCVRGLLGGGGVVVHHWDADGVASAALLSRAAGGSALSFVVPRIGEYSAEAVLSMGPPRGSSTVFVVDYGVPPRELRALGEGLGSRVAVIDHHLSGARGELVCNPVSCGAGGEDEYPSTTWVIHRLLGAPGDGLDLVALGLAGDLGHFLVEHPLYKWVAGVLSDLGLSQWDLVEAVERVDSCYKSIDYRCIDHARRLLAEGGIGLVLSDSALADRAAVVRDRVRSVLEGIRPTGRRGPILLYSLDLDLYVTSAVGRELAYRSPGMIVVLRHRIRSLGREYIYVRSRSHMLRGALEELRGMGLCVGGKDRVFAVSCRGRCSDDVVEAVISSILRHASLSP